MKFTRHKSDPKTFLRSLIGTWDKSNATRVYSSGLGLNRLDLVDLKLSAVALGM